MVTWVRNKLYDLGIKKSRQYDFPVICVGNLSVGGTGKTPMIEYLIRLLKDDYRLATLSRGYKRKTKGFLVADEKATAESIGDEPFQFHEKFKNTIRVAVDSNRVNGIDGLRGLDNCPEVVLLDDAFQHRKVKAGFNILLTTYSNPFFSDIVLPTGDLREPRSGYQRADAIVVTKCPTNLDETEKAQFAKKIRPKKGQQVFFSSISYSAEVFSGQAQKDLRQIGEFTLVTGIANAKPLVDFLKSKHLSFEHLSFKDHHGFTEKEISILEKKSLIITTEKDFMRLKKYDSLKGKLVYLPIAMTIDAPEKFNDLINAFLSSY